MQVLNFSKLIFEKRVCDFCGSNDFKPTQTVNFLGLNFQFVRCSSCQLVYQNPLLSRESRNHLYETREYWDNKGSDMKTEKMLNYYSYIEEAENRRKTDKFRVDWVTSRLPSNSRILDLGCGDGLYVDMLKKSGFQAYGMDISSAMIAIAKNKYNIEIIQGDAEKEWAFEEPFDAIVCYTISNFINPSLVFKQIQTNLRQGGYFFFNFADCENLLSRLMGKHFYVYRPSAAIVYSKKTIMAYCKKFGLRIESIKNDTQMIPLARFFGMLGLPSFIGGFKFIGVDHWDIKTTLPTSYMACAVRKG